MSLVERFLQLERTLRTLAATPSGRSIMPYLSTLGWVLLWAWYDFIVVGLAFRPTRCAACPEPNIELYWIATWYVLFPIATLLTFRERAWLPILAVWVGGWEDILFYWIQGLPVPARTPWVLLAPTAELLYLKAALFLLASVLGQILYGGRLERRRSGSNGLGPKQ